MIRRLLAVWHDRNLTVAGRARYPGYLYRHLLAALREPKEPPRAGEHPCRYCHDLCDCTDGACCGPDADPATPAVQLPAVPGPHQGDGAVTAVQWEGATEDWSPVHEQPQRPASAALPETRAMRLEADRVLHEELSKVEADLRAAYDAWWAEFLARIGLGEEDLVEVGSFAEATTLAGAFALPAVAVDWSTGEFPLVGAR